MSGTRISYFLAAALAFGVAIGGPKAHAQSTTATIDFGSSNQTIEGYGGSTAWMPQLSTAQADALFANSSLTEMGLSILRVRIDPGGTANWGTELQNALAAKARGAIIIATPWTPPAALKTNDSTIMGSLKTTAYGSFSAYLRNYVAYMARGGAPLYAISLQNEPDANVTYESCVWTGAQIDSWVAAYGANLGTKFFVSESEGFNTSLTDPTLNDSKAVNKVSFIAGHIYGVSPTYYSNAFAKGKEVWMTEHYVTDTGITGAMELAKEVSDSMAVANYSAYVYWWALDWTAEDYADGLVDSSNAVKLNGYILAQWSKFVRPGYVRSNATYNPTTNVYVTAFKGSGHFVVVAVNLATSTVSQSFTIENQTLTSLTPYQTSNASQTMTQGSAIAVSNGSFTANLPAQSVTTFVQ